MSLNEDLQRAKRQRNDEFHTQRSDIENELRHYTGHFVKGGEKPDQRAEQNTATAAVGVRWSEEVGVRLGAAGAGNAGRA